MIEAQDAPTQLYHAKLRLADGLNCRDLLADLERADRDLARVLAGQIELDGAVAAAKAALGDAETLAGLSVEGKNEQERRVNRAIALQRDPQYQNAALEVRRAEIRLAEQSAALETAKRAAKRLERTIDYRVAVLRFLAG